MDSSNGGSGDSNESISYEDFQDLLDGIESGEIKSQPKSQPKEEVTEEPEEDVAEDTTLQDSLFMEIFGMEFNEEDEEHQEQMELINLIIESNPNATPAEIVTQYVRDNVVLAD